MADDEPLELSDEESLVLLNFEPGTGSAQLSESLGLPEERLKAAVQRLTSLGLLDPVALFPPESETVSDLPALDLGFDLSDITLDDDKPAKEVLETSEASGGLRARSPHRPPRAEKASEHPPPRSSERPPKRPEVEPSSSSSSSSSTLTRAVTPKVAPTIADPPTLESAEGKAVDEVTTETATAVKVAETSEQSEENEATEEKDAPETSEERTREYRKLYETELHPLSVDERAKLAQTVTGDLLMAFTFEPDPTVLSALFDNTAVNLEHVRAIAFHHRTGRGLELIGSKPALLRDPQVQRKLLRNPSATDGIIKKVLQPKRLIDAYKTVLDREVPEKNRSSALQTLRQKWTTSQPEERVELIWSTEARVLSQLVGATFDSKTTALLCSRQIVSIVMITTFARFAATPPSLLNHLLKQPIVKRQVHLRNQLLQHPNVPAEAKRRF